MNIYVYIYTYIYIYTYTHVIHTCMHCAPRKRAFHTARICASASCIIQGGEDS